MFYSLEALGQGASKKVTCVCTKTCYLFMTTVSSCVFKSKKLAHWVTSAGTLIAKMEHLNPFVFLLTHKCLIHINYSVKSVERYETFKHGVNFKVKQQICTF